jgi:hypothetical protein
LIIVLLFYTGKPSKSGVTAPGRVFWRMRCQDDTEIAHAWAGLKPAPTRTSPVVDPIEVDEASITKGDDYPRVDKIL